MSVRVFAVGVTWAGIDVAARHVGGPAPLPHRDVQCACSHRREALAKDKALIERINREHAEREFRETGKWNSDWTD